MGLTMCMGLGCNAVGVTGCRIISSPRERMMAILTNSLIPCNGRFGALLLLLTAYFAPRGGSAGAALGLTVCIAAGVAAAMGISWVLSRTLLRGMPTAFVLELPPFRRPQVGQVILRSVVDRTLIVLRRAAAAAVPAGLVLWCLGHVMVGQQSLLQFLSAALEPVGACMGLSGVLLLAFLLGFPANEIVMPVALLIAGGSWGMETDAAALSSGLMAMGVDWKTAVCLIIFFLFHWPCATTCMTIYRESGSVKWTLWAVVIPTALGTALCILLHHLL